MIADDSFADLDAYIALPRANGLCLSPDGQRLVTAVQSLDAKKTGYVSGLWEVDPSGAGPARELTHGARGESVVGFTSEGDVLFTSLRPRPGADNEDPSVALWRLPANGDDPEVVFAPPGGVSRVVVARDAGTIVAMTAVHPSAETLAQEEELRAARRDGRVSAILHESYPVRYWDHDLGPTRMRLFALGDTPCDLTGDTGQAMLFRTDWDVSPDGRTVVTTWTVPEPGGSLRFTLVAIDVATGDRRILADDEYHEFIGLRISPDGAQAAVVVAERSTDARAGDSWLALVPLAGGEMRVLAGGWDRWPHSPEWTPDGSALVVAADDLGHAPLWRVDVATGEVVRLTESGSWTDARISPDGRWVYAMRSALDSAPAPYRVPLAGGATERLDGPLSEIPLPGRLEEVSTTTQDGFTVRGWLAVPEGASAANPAPLLLWPNGGPLMSWATWHWRWNPWLAVARGYAVLQPDVALSTGYGIEFIRRSWGEWGGAPYTDTMAITDAALERADLDSSRTGVMGGSHGGYMANWIAGHTNRFDAVVTHASVWAIDQMGVTTDCSFYWARELNAEQVRRNSPHHFADNIVTPMLVIHGDGDYRVPVGESLRLWWDLQSRQKSEGAGGPHKFLYFPDESHWVLKPNHVKLWYATIYAFLAHHVLGQDWQRPELLG